jgi:hypothetical protein
MAWSIRVEDCALGATNVVCDKVLVENGIAEFNSAGLAKFDLVLVFDDVE